MEKKLNSLAKQKNLLREQSVSKNTKDRDKQNVFDCSMTLFLPTSRRTVVTFILRDRNVFILFPNTIKLIITRHTISSAAGNVQSEHKVFP